MEKERFYVVTAIFNPCGYKRRYELFKEFEARMKAQKIKLMVIECAFNDQPFAITSEKNPSHIQVRSSSIMWIKENLINICISKLPSLWKYVAWIDADVEFENKDWVRDSISLLKKFKVIQLFGECVFLDKDNTPGIKKESFVYKYFKDNLLSPSNTPSTSPKKKANPYFLPPIGTAKKAQEKEYGHPGFAWAIGRETFERLGGLIDFAITGAADTFMAYSFIGELKSTTIPIKNKRYLAKLQEWEKKCSTTVFKSIGYLKGTIRHYWHGEMKDRQYYEREKILYDFNYDPATDIKKDMQGVLQFVNPSSELVSELYHYFLGRKEDS